LGFHLQALRFELCNLLASVFLLDDPFYHHVDVSLPLTLNASAL